jgi:hypothetical protein
MCEYLTKEVINTLKRKHKMTTNTIPTLLDDFGFSTHTHEGPIVIVKWGQVYTRFDTTATEAQQ